jgi:pyruvate dehydrogenase E1 component
MAAQATPQDDDRKVDADSLETREWMDALTAVIQAEGPARAHDLLEQLLEHARQHSIDMPFSANTGYVNTLEPEEEERNPGNLEIEGRLRAYMRWNAMAMVVKANRLHPADGGDLGAHQLVPVARAHDGCGLQPFLACRRHRCRWHARR